MKTEILVVGAGFAGCVIAQRLAECGRGVLIIDKRPHIGGNAYDEVDPNGVLVHRYGPHIFHTNSRRVFEYLSQFTSWRPYEHRVLAVVGGQHFPIPINQETVNRLYGLNLDEAGVAKFFEQVRVPCQSIRTSEDVVLSSVGPDLCEKFFRGYTRKQWDLDLSELNATVAARIPVRTNSDDRYFSDQYQAMPAEGYTKMFLRMTDHSNIRIQLETDYFNMRDQVDAKLVIYTGPIDAYFNYCYGSLPYRSLRFEHEHLESQEWFQSVGTVNFPNDHRYTRITEFKHLTGQVCKGTSIVREYPQAEGDPYYPIPRAQNEELLQRYKYLADNEKNTVFIGRLAQYRYYNMDQVAAAALTAADRILSLKAGCS